MNGMKYKTNDYSKIINKDGAQELRWNINDIINESAYFYITKNVSREGYSTYETNFFWIDNYCIKIYIFNGNAIDIVFATQKNENIEKIHISKAGDKYAGFTAYNLKGRLTKENMDIKQLIYEFIIEWVNAKSFDPE